MKMMTTLNMNQFEIKNALIQGLASAPTNPSVNQYYWNTTSKTLNVWDGTQWVEVGIQYVLPKASATVLGGIKIGQYLSIDEDGVCSVVEATTASKGVVRLATDAEITTGTETDAVVTPKQLKDKIDSEKGVAGGIATLDDRGLVPASQLPSFVNDVVEAHIVGSTSFASDWLSESEGGEPLTPSFSKIYVIVTTGQYHNKFYSWTGSQYIEAIHKFTQTNPVLTPVDNICTWTITNVLNDGDVNVQVKEIETNEVVYTDIISTSSTVTIKMNSTINIEESKYKAIIVG